MKKIFSYLLLAQLAIFASCDKGPGTANGDPATDAAKTAAAAQTATAAPPPSPAGATMVLIETSLGNIKAKLYDTTPQHRDNFIKLAKEGYFNGTLFHRVIPGFMVQGGDPDSKNAKPGQPLGMGGPGYTIPAEIGAKHYRGALSAARTGGPSNPEMRSSGSQFYIVQNGPVPPQQMEAMIQQRGLQYTPEEKAYYLNYGGTPFLDGEYTVFGMVTEGLDVVDKIATAQKAPGDRPVQDIKMKVSVIQ